MQRIRDLADEYFADLLPLDPYLATAVGEPGYGDRLTDYSPEGVAERAALARRTLAALDTVAPADEADRLCGALLRDRLGAELEAFDSGEHLRPLRILGSPVSSV